MLSGGGGGGGGETGFKQVFFSFSSLLPLCRFLGGFGGHRHPLSPDDKENAQLTAADHRRRQDGSGGGANGGAAQKGARK